QPFSFENRTTRFDLEVYLWEKADESLACSFVYNSDLFDANTVRRMIGHFEKLLENIVANPDTRIHQFELLSATERDQLLTEWNDTSKEYRLEKSIPELFEEQVGRRPEAWAVSCEGTQLTYRELNERANQFAHYLKKLGVGPDQMVGICMERSLEMVVALLGILKAGGAYLPLDPGYPVDRLSFMLEDASIKVLVTQSQLLVRLPAGSGKVI